MPSELEWIERLSDRDVAELESAAKHARSNTPGMHAATRADFPLTDLPERIASWRAELDGGRGFVVLRGLPVEDWGEELSGWAYWGLGQHLGRPGAQNPAEELLGHVIDTGEDAENENIRAYRTSANIRFHCDLADVVGLLCLQTAKTGGASRIVSSVAVYNRLVAEHPEMIERLYEPFLLDARGENDSAMRYVPVPMCRYADGRLKTFFHSDYFRSVVRHEDVGPLPEADAALLDTYEDIASRPELRFDMDLEIGDIQLLSNHTVLHARTDYVDHDDPERKRHLLRLWLSL